MKICTAVAAVGIFIGGGIAVRGASMAQPAPVDRLINKTAEVAELTEAYVTLAKADHDYKGHRAAAMRAIEKACDILGTDIRDKGKGHQPQTLSDDELREARRKVAEVRDASKLADQKDVAAHLDEAVAELDLALTVK